MMTVLNENQTTACSICSAQPRYCINAERDALFLDLTEALTVDAWWVTVAARLRGLAGTWRGSWGGGDGGADDAASVVGFKNS
jgi:hypothetical protein